MDDKKTFKVNLLKQMLNDTGRPYEEVAKMIGLSVLELNNLLDEKLSSDEWNFLYDKAEELNCYKDYTMGIKKDLSVDYIIDTDDQLYQVIDEIWYKDKDEDGNWVNNCVESYLSYNKQTGNVSFESIFCIDESMQIYFTKSELLSFSNEYLKQAFPVLCSCNTKNRLNKTNICVECIIAREYIKCVIQ